MFDWQTLVVAVIVLAALLYTGRRAWSRLRAFRAKRAGEDAAACETGCGSCGTAKGSTPAPSTHRTVFVEISRIKPNPSRTERR